MDGRMIREQYLHWLLMKVLVDCWTVRKCADYLGRDARVVQDDFDKAVDMTPKTK